EVAHVGAEGPDRGRVAGEEEGHALVEDRVEGRAGEDRDGARGIAGRRADPQSPDASRPRQHPSPYWKKASGGTPGSSRTEASMSTGGTVSTLNPHCKLESERVFEGLKPLNRY